MNKYLLFLLVFGMGVTQTSVAAIEITNESHSYTSSQNTYTIRNGAHVSSNFEVSRAIDALSAEAAIKEYQLVILKNESKEYQRLELLKLAKKPNAMIGMTINQVLHESNWGHPNNINTTIDASGKSEQWIYGDGQYLYFQNGKLTSIQY